MTDGGAAAAGGPPQVVRVKRELLAACMTCPLCEKLLVEATTISECLHTFCRKCIFEKLTDEEIDCCPICNIDLGCVPVEKLRPDHNLGDVRAKIFPLRRKKVGAPEVVPSIAFPIRRKERSLSSLVVNMPRITTHRSLTGRRTRAIARRASALRRPSPSIDESIKKEEENVEDLADNSSSPDNLNKLTQNRRQNSSIAEASNHKSIKNKENYGECFLNKGELWKPLNCLVEAANRTKACGTPLIKTEQINGAASEVRLHNSKLKEQLHKSKVQDENNGSTPMSQVIIKTKRLSGIKRKKRELRTSAQALLDAAVAKRERRTCPIWLSLIASFDEKGVLPLPQIDVSYLRIKDADLPVSFIQRYLVKKLNLSSEDEVEIRCRCQPLNPALALHNLIDLWLHTGTLQSIGASEKLEASVGATAKDFVMVLTYSRKASPP